MSNLSAAINPRHISSEEWRKLVEQIDWSTASNAINLGTEPRECKAVPLSEVVGDRLFNLEGLFAGFSNYRLLNIDPRDSFLVKPEGAECTSIAHKGIVKLTA